jgi:hypothetical protein
MRSMEQESCRREALLRPRSADQLPVLRCCQLPSGPAERGSVAMIQCPKYRASTADGSLTLRLR